MEMQVEIRFKKCGISNQPDVCICDDPCLSKFGALRGCMSASRRQWADFLVSLMAPLHRQYKTARTETRRHLLLKIRQMPTQTSASRGYVLFRGVIGTHTKVLKLSAGLRTHSVECSKLGKTQIIEDARRGVVKNTGFCGQNCRRPFYSGAFCSRVFL